MTDHMKEAERLLEQYDDACLGIIGMSEEQARAALLAHIQRRVPEGWQVVPIDPTPEMLDAAEGVDWGDEDMRGSCCNQWHAMLAAAPDHFRDAAEMVAEPADDRIAAALHYPECWDTAAYPTVESALSEVYAHYRCTEHDAPAEVPMPEPVDDIDRALVPLSDHDRLTIGPGPWAGVRIGQKAFNVARAVFGTSSEDDDKRVYRTLQAYEQNRTQISGESTQADFERWLERDSTLPATRDGGTYSDFSVALMWHAWQECAACRAAGEAAGYARGLAEAGRDAKEWGNALNDAGWAFDSAYHRHMGEPTPPRLFNTAKTILRDAIIAYTAALRGEVKP